MGFITLTYSLTNGSTADASQVMQNYNDIVNGTSDGTKDFNINALTCAGTVTFNGSSFVFGNQSTDSISFTGSLGSSIPILTTNSYNIGSATSGLLSIYFGSDDTDTVRLKGPTTIASSYTLTVPPTAGSSRDIIQSDGSGTLTFVPIRRSSDDLQNVGLTATVGSSALTLTLVGTNGSAPSSTNPVDVVFRNATSTNGTPTTVTVTSSVSLVISSGSTLGHSSGNQHYIHVYALNNSGTLELAAISVPVDQGSIVSTTAEGGAGAADSNNVMYSTTARSNVPCRLLARLKSTQATAGTWATVPSEISIYPFDPVPVVMSAYRNGSDTFGTGADSTVVIDTKLSDPYNILNTTTGIATIPVTGLYQVNAGIRFASNSTGDRVIGLTDGSINYGFNSIKANSSTITRIRFSNAFTISAGVGLKVIGNQDSGGNLDINGGRTDTFFSIIKIG